MKRATLGLTHFLTGLLATTSLMAGDVEDVKAAYLRHITLSRTGQVDAFVEQHLPGHTAFGPDGGLFIRFESLEDEKHFRRAAAEATRRQNPDATSQTTLAREVRHLNVDIYNDTAVVTGYLRAPVTLTDGRTVPGTRRVTAIWVRVADQWREVHDHMSTLLAGPLPE